MNINDDIYVNNNIDDNIADNNIDDNNELSWSSIVDKECIIENKLLTSSINDDTNDNIDKKIKKETNYQYSIADILIKDPTTIDDIKLLEFQTYITSNLKKYIKQYMCADSHTSDIDLKLHINKFEWLAAASYYLSNKLGLHINLHKESLINVYSGIIPRSSYKFCEFNYECEFNYKNIKQGHTHTHTNGLIPSKTTHVRGCYAQHYVHNIVYADIIAIICYINEVYNKNATFKLCELDKCITTISFVMKHMTEELTHANYHYCNSTNPLHLVHMERYVQQPLSSHQSQQKQTKYKQDFSKKKSKPSKTFQ